MPKNAVADRRQRLKRVRCAMGQMERVLATLHGGSWTIADGARLKNLRWTLATLIEEIQQDEISAALSTERRTRHAIHPATDRAA